MTEIQTKRGHEYMTRRGVLMLAALGVGAAVFAVWLGWVNFAVFHLAIELTNLAICASVFTIGWNTRHITNEDSFSIMGAGYLACALLEFAHMLTHGQHPIVPVSDPYVTIQFWLAARTMVAISLLHAAYVRLRGVKISRELILVAYVLAAVGAALSIATFSREADPYFIPPLRIPLQVGWRLAVMGAVLAGFWMLRWPPVGRWPENKLFLAAIVFSEIAGQVAFLLQTDLAGPAAIFGHLFKIAIRICVYRILVTAALQDPYNTLFRDLTEAVMIMRAQRHDMINDLTLASTYLQMNRIEDAEQCIAVIAADLSDRYNYATLPKDAWYQVIAAKSDIARSQGVDFRYRLDAPMPDDFHQRRLLPKLVGNLLDNAIDAVAGTENPWISLEWSRTEAGTVLRVSNSGSEIPLELRSKLFEPGLSTKGNNRGFGLTICRKIANELGASLTVESNSEATTFTLTLPPARVEQARISL